jgi:hypothetical protein
MTGSRDTDVQSKTPRLPSQPQHVIHALHHLEYYLGR